jgi:hypothetical protein
MSHRDPRDSGQRGAGPERLTRFVDDTFSQTRARTYSLTEL